MDAVEALHVGRPVLLPTDGVYGLCCALDEAAARQLYALKGRSERQPTALIAASVGVLADLLPELDAQARAIVTALLPGPYTLILANPARRFGWITGERPTTIGVRVALMPAATQRVLDAVSHWLHAPVTASVSEHRTTEASLPELDAALRQALAETPGSAPSSPSTTDAVADRIARVGALVGLRRAMYPQASWGEPSHAAAGVSP